LGAIAFLVGLFLPLVLLRLESFNEEERLYNWNLVVGTAIVYVALGGVLVVNAASALAQGSSTPFRMHSPWVVLPFFPVLVFVGNVLTDNPDQAPWLFPIVNVAMVSIPSVSVALLVAWRYATHHPYAWPLSWREWSSGFIYGAIGATTIAGMING